MMTMKRRDDRLPAGWDETRVRGVLDHYEGQSEEEALAEDERAVAEATFMAVPRDLVSEVRQLIADHETKKAS
jgi:hypothetical protein